jgi:hypothetical protein
MVLLWFVWSGNLASGPGGILASGPGGANERLIQGDWEDDSDSGEKLKFRNGEVIVVTIFWGRAYTYTENTSSSTNRPSRFLSFKEENKGRRKQRRRENKGSKVSLDISYG